MATPQQIVKGQGVLLRKMIEKNPKCIADAKAMLQEWSKIKCDVSVNTRWIREPILKKNLEKFGDLFKAPELLTIEPIGLNNMCHNNAIEFSALYPNEFECVVGYNVCSCKCGSILAYEVHSVVKDKATGKHYDITKDFAGEKKKWFVPMKFPNEIHYLKMKKALGRKYDIFSFGYDECKCSVHWNNTSPPLNIKKFKQDIEELGRA